MQSLSRIWESVSVRMGRSSQGSAAQLQESLSGSGRDNADEDADEPVDGSDSGSQEDAGWGVGPRRDRSGAADSDGDGTVSRGDAEPLLDADDADGETDDSGDVDFGDIEEEEEALFEREEPQRLPAAAAAAAAADGRGVFNGGFVHEGEEDEEADWEEEEMEEQDGDEEDEEDEEDESTDACFGMDTIAAGRLGTSSIDAPADQRPQPKIVGYLETEMIFDIKGPSLNVRVLGVELNIGLTKFRRKSNKKMRWTHMQVCLTMLPTKELKFRTLMMDHADPRKKRLPGAAGAAAAADAGDKVDGEAAEKGKDGGDSGKKEADKEEKEKNKDKEEEKNKDKEEKKGKKGKAARPAAPSAARERKAAVAALATRRAEAKQEQEERHLERQRQLKELEQRLEEERLRKAMGGGGKPTEEFKQDVTKFAEPADKLKKGPAAPGGGAAVEGGKKAKGDGEKQEEERTTFKFLPVYAYQLKNKAPQPLAVRFRVYGCLRGRRTFLLGENMFALERLDEFKLQGKTKWTRFMLQLEERRFALSKLKHLSDSEDEVEQRKAAEKAQKARKDALDALMPPPTEGPSLVNQGEVFLGLSYNMKNGHLEVEVVKACNLANPRTVKPPDTYVKIRLLWGPEKKSPGRVLFKSRTLCIPDSRNPAWNEAFAFPVSRNHLNDVSVMAEVYCKHALRTVSLGWCSLGRNSCSEEALDHWSEMRDAAGKQVSSWHVLLRVSKVKTEGQLDSD